MQKYFKIRGLLCIVNIHNMYDKYAKTKSDILSVVKHSYFQNKPLCILMQNNKR